MGVSEMRVDEVIGGGRGRHAAQAYWNALAKLRTAWREVFDEDLPTHGNRAMGAFEQALALMKARLADDAMGGDRLLSVLDVQDSEDVASVLLGYADMDDLAPGMVKRAMIDECRRRGSGRVEVRDFLRPVLDRLFSDQRTRRPRVGANRHWPRLLQYLRELQDETDWTPEGCGIRLVNAKGGGLVARDPADPARLAIRIDAEFL